MTMVDEARDLDVHRWKSLAVLLTGSVLVFADTGIMLVAIPAMQRTLHATSGQLALALSIYQIVFGVAVVAAGRLGDLWGRRRVLVSGVAGFVASSALCGAAVSGTALVFSRAAQGLCAAVIMPHAAAYVRTAFPAAERPRAFAISGGAVGTAAIAGPAVGGLAVAVSPFGLSWRAAFLLNVPVGLAMLAAIVSRFPDDRPATRTRGQLDLAGAAVLGLALTALLTPLLTGRDEGWPWWEFAVMALSVPLLLAFLATERGRAASGAPAVLPPSLLGNRVFRGSLAVYLLLFGSAGAFSLVLVLYAQQGLGMSALQASAVAAASPVGSLTAMFGSGRVGRLFGDRTLTVGFFGVWGCTAALVLQVPLLHRPDDGFWLVPLVALSGFCFGMVTPRLLSFALGAVESAEAGAASGALSSVQTISRGLGIAAIGSLFLAVAAVAGGVPQYLRQAAPAVASCVSAALSKGDGASARAVCPAAPRHGPHPAVASAVNGVVHHAFSAAYTASLLTMAALFLVSLALARRCGALTNGVRR